MSCHDLCRTRFCSCSLCILVSQLCHSTWAGQTRPLGATPRRLSDRETLMSLRTVSDFSSNMWPTRSSAVRSLLLLNHWATENLHDHRSPLQCFCTQGFWVDFTGFIGHIEWIYRSRWGKQKPTKVQNPGSEVRANNGTETEAGVGNPNEGRKRQIKPIQGYSKTLVGNKLKCHHFEGVVGVCRTSLETVCWMS